MLKEAFEFFTGKVSEAEGVKVVEFGDRTKRLIVQGGQREVVTLPDPDARREVLSFVDLAAAYTAAICEAEVWFTIDLARFYTDEPQRQSYVSLPLAKSYLWGVVMRFKTAQQLDQGGLVELLRNELPMVLQNPAIVEVFSTINWTANEQQRVAMANANRSLDADIAQRAVGYNSAELPDEIIVSVAPYVNHQLFDRVLNLRLRVETKPLEKRFRVWLDPSSLEAAERLMADWVRGEIQTHLPEATAIYGTGDKR